MKFSVQKSYIFSKCWLVPAVCRRSGPWKFGVIVATIRFLITGWVWNQSGCRFYPCSTPPVSLKQKLIRNKWLGLRKSCMSSTFHVRLAQSTVDLGLLVPHLRQSVSNLGLKWRVMNWTAKLAQWLHLAFLFLIWGEGEAVFIYNRTLLSSHLCWVTQLLHYCFKILLFFYKS